MSYYVRWPDEADTQLAIINVTSGVSTVVGAFFEINGEFVVPVTVDSIAIGANGSAFAINNYTLYSLDLATAELTEIGTMSVTSFYSFAFDSVSGKCYASTTDNDVYEVDVSDGTLTGLGSLSFTEGADYDYTYSLQFDQAGTAWIEADNSLPGGAGLHSFSLGDLSATVYSGNFTDDPFYTEALLIIPGAPTALASTGADSSQVPLFVGGALLLTVIGVVLLVARRRTAE